MLGNIEIIKQLMMKTQNPVSGGIKDIPEKRVLDVIINEYWLEWKDRIVYSPCSSIHVKNLGNFTADLVPLKKNIGELVRDIRKKRKRLEKIQKNKNFNPENSATVLYLNIATKKLKASLAQLDEQRKLMIMRYMLYTIKHRTNNPDFSPKYNYMWFPYSFREKVLNNNKYVQ